VAESLANRRAAVERWREIVRLADSARLADKETEAFVRVSSRYGLHLYRIYEAGWTVMLLTRQREVTGKTDEAEIAAAITRYDDAWRDYRALASEPTCATLFDDHFAKYRISQDHNSIDPIPGMGAEVDKARRHAAAAACAAVANPLSDGPARATPDWFRKGVMYQIQPRAFTPEGTIKAAEAKLE
jgi:hypothetical protein